MSAPQKAGEVRLRLLGEMALSRGAEPLALPQSKKTRALLAFLALTGRPQRRERLTAMFWDIPDDPRGALRWSLSRLRQVIDSPHRPRIVADRETVALDRIDLWIDAVELRRLAADPATVEIDALREAAESMSGRFLEGLDLPACPDYEAWRIAEEEETRRAQIGLLGHLLDRLAERPEDALPHARTLARLDPYSERSQARLVTLLRALGRRREADEHVRSARARLAEAGVAETGQLSAPSEAAAAPPEPARQPAPEADRPALDQDIRFCTTADGVRIAYATVGDGPPLVKAANWLNHLEFDWHSPVWRHLFGALAARHRLVRYDERGNGLSDREVAEISFDAFVRDLETVADAAGLDRFPLLGISQGCPVAIAYAVRHPERVTRLVLYGGYARGRNRRDDPANAASSEALLTLIRQGWGQATPAFRQLFTSLYMPGGRAEQYQWFNDLQRTTTSPETAARIQAAWFEIDVTGLLPRLHVPTLVLHATGDAAVPFDEGRLLAARIPGARFVPLESDNHILLEHDPAWPRFIGEVLAFLAE